MCKSKVHLSWQMLIFWSLNFLLCTAVLTIIILLPIKTYLEFFKSKTKKIMNTASIYMYLGLGPRIDPSTPQPPYDFGELFEEHPKNIKKAVWQKKIWLLWYVQDLSFFLFLPGKK